MSLFPISEPSFLPEDLVFTSIIDTYSSGSLQNILFFSEKVPYICSFPDVEFSRKAIHVNKKLNPWTIPRTICRYFFGDSQTLIVVAMRGIYSYDCGKFNAEMVMIREYLPENQIFQAKIQDGVMTARNKHGWVVYDLRNERYCEFQSDLCNSIGYCQWDDSLYTLATHRDGLWVYRHPISFVFLESELKLDDKYQILNVSSFIRGIEPKFTDFNTLYLGIIGKYLNIRGRVDRNEDGDFFWEIGKKFVRKWCLLPMEYTFDSRLRSLEAVSFRFI